MARRGPKPKTAKTTRRRPVSEAGLECPAHLTGDAAEAWSKLVDLLIESGNIDRTDPVMIESYALNYALMRRSYELVMRDGAVITSRLGGSMANPACKVMNAASTRLRSIIHDLGLCPATSKFAPETKAVIDSRDERWAGLLNVAG